MKMKENIENESKNGNEDNNNEDDIEIMQKKEEKKKENQGRIDYFCPHLWPFIMFNIVNECKKFSKNDKFKLNSPIEEITKLNLQYLYVYLNVLNIGNLLIMTVEIKNEFDKLLFELGIIEKSNEEKAAKLNEKENRYANKLLQKLGYVKCIRKNDVKDERGKRI